MVSDSALSQKNYLQLAGIRFTPEMIEVVENGNIARRVFRSDIKALKLGHGFQTPRPIVQACTGVVLFAVGVQAARDLIYWLEQGNTVRPYYHLVLMGFMVLGAWLMRDSARRGYFLLITTHDSWEKLPFHSRAESGELDRFLKQVSIEFGYVLQHVSLAA